MKGDVTVCGMLTADSDLYEIAPFVGSVFQNPKSQFYRDDTTIIFAWKKIRRERKNYLPQPQKVLNISTKPLQ